MAKLVCPKCGSADVYCGGMNPVQCNAVCRHCGFEVTGMLNIRRFFEGEASYATYEAERKNRVATSEDARKESERRSREIAAQRASCSHEWRYNVMDGVGVRFCPKCGALEQD